jgi:hypothetical protein
MFIAACCLGILPANIAQRKGKNFLVWWIYGTFLWIVAIFHAISLPEIENSSTKDKKSNKFFDDLVLIYEELIEEIDLNSPVEIKSYQLLKNSDNEIFLRIQFKNLNEGEVTALKISIAGENSFGDPIYINGNLIFEVTLQDLNLEKGGAYENEIKVPSNDIRKVKLKITQVMFTNQEKIKIYNNYIKPYKIKITNQDALRCAKSISSDAEYYYSENSEYWVCKCGMSNRPESTICSNCLSEKYIVQKKFAEDYIINHSLPEFLKQQKVELEEKDAQNKIEEDLKKKVLQKKRRQRIMLYKLTGVIVALTCFGFLINLGFSTYKINNLIQNNKYEEAFNQLGNLDAITFSDKDELISKLQQQFHSSLANNDILKIDELTICADKNTIYSLDKNKNKTVYFELSNEKYDEYNNKKNDNLFNTKGKIMYTKGYLLFISDFTGINTLYIIDMEDPTKDEISMIDGAKYGVGVFDTIRLVSLTKLYDGNILLGYYKSAVSSEDRWILFTPGGIAKRDKILYLSSEELKRAYSVTPPKIVNSDGFDELINSINYIYTTNKDLEN